VFDFFFLKILIYTVLNYFKESANRDQKMSSN
jgi:hypothetical protein